MSVSPLSRPRTRLVGGITSPVPLGSLGYSRTAKVAYTGGSQVPPAV
jgi:hypothetical protein